MPTTPPCARLIAVFSSGPKTTPTSPALYFAFYNFVRIHRTFGGLRLWRRVRSAMVMEDVIASIDRRNELRAGTLRVG
jgi:hypothetical protein